MLKWFENSDKTFSLSKTKSLRRMLMNYCKGVTYCERIFFLKILGMHWFSKFLKIFNYLYLKNDSWILSSIMMSNSSFYINVCMYWWLEKVKFWYLLYNPENMVRTSPHVLIRSGGPGFNFSTALNTKVSFTHRCKSN